MDDKERSENIIKEVYADNADKPHPKNDAELQEILEKTKELGGPKEGTTKFGDWSKNGKAIDW